MKDDQLAANIAEWIKDHQYTCLADANGVEVWRCQKPGSVNLAFDICITRFGISMFGDIDSLVFSVGASYGLGFLARTPDGYMIEKLDERYRSEREFDEDYFREQVCEAIFERLEESEVQLPDWMADQTLRRGKFDDLTTWLEERLEDENQPLPEDIDLQDLQEILGEAADIEDDAAGHALLHEHEDTLNISDTWECRLTKPSKSLVRRLHYVSHAARQILAIKAAAEQVAHPC